MPVSAGASAQLRRAGRGRGINWIAETPLEVHMLADVVLPVAYERTLAWETVCPNVVQKMLLAGLAVDSPADATLLHPTLFENASQAEKAFQRSGFGEHFPIRDTYGEMSTKSATYRLSGRGHGWQSTTWISTTRQGASGLGLEAQRNAIDRFAASRGAEVLGRFTEVESGKNPNRPELTKAIQLARLTGATLVIVKLDRLSRNAAFLLTLRDSGVHFLASTCRKRMT